MDEAIFRREVAWFAEGFWDLNPRAARQMVVGPGFEPGKALASRFTVYLMTFPTYFLLNSYAI